MHTPTMLALTRDPSLQSCQCGFWPSGHRAEDLLLCIVVLCSWRKRMSPTLMGNHWVKGAKSTWEIAASNGAMSTVGRLLANDELTPSQHAKPSSLSRFSGKHRVPFDLRWNPGFNRRHASVHCHSAEVERMFAQHGYTLNS